MIPSTTLVYQRNGSAMDLMKRVTSIQSLVKVYGEMKKAEEYGGMSLLVLMIQREEYSLVYGIILLSMWSLLESIYYSMQKILEYLLKELLRRIKIVSMQTRKSVTVSSLIICQLRNLKNLTVNR